MSVSLSRNPPKYRLHKARNVAVVRIDGRDYYLGPYDSPESHEKYHRLIADWVSGRPFATSEPKPSAQSEKKLSVNEMLLAFWNHAESYYSIDGQPSKELSCFKYSIRPLRELFGMTSAVDFGPKSLKQLQQQMVQSGICRRLINSRINRIRRIFKWAVSEELVPPAIFEGLRTVAGLRFGRTAARESEPVKPAADSDVEGVLPFVSPHVATMVRLQRLTGMRPGEVCGMRPIDIDRSRETWLYRPPKHKTSYRGHERVVPLGPRAQALLVPFLDRSADSYCFSPKEAEQRRNEQRAVQRNPNRRTKIYPCELRARERRIVARMSRSPKRPKGDRYDTTSYRRAVDYGIKRAKAAGVVVAHWHPHQLRHSRATEIRREYGLEGAQVALGHQNADVSQVYAERDLSLAIRIAQETG